VPNRYWRCSHKIITNVNKVQLISDVGMSMNHQDAVQPCLVYYSVSSHFSGGTCMHCGRLSSLLPRLKELGWLVIMQRATGTSELHTCYVWNDKQTRELISYQLVEKKNGPKSGAAMAAPAAAAPLPLIIQCHPERYYTSCRCVLVAVLNCLFRLPPLHSKQWNLYFLRIW